MTARERVHRLLHNPTGDSPSSLWFNRFLALATFFLGGLASPTMTG
jgi:hypothetical protein